jgi:hypothetical protein
MALETIKELMRKIHQLAEKGVGGEAENAQKKLATLLTRYGMTIDDITAEEMKTYPFRYTGKRDSTLLRQCAAKVMGKWRGEYSFRRGQSKQKTREMIGFDLTATEHADLTEMLAYYREAYEKECDAMLAAFIQHHELFPDTTANPDKEGISLEEMKALRQRMAALQEKSFVKIAGYIK